MQRHTFQHDNLTLSYLDSGNEGPLLIALHAHWMEGVTFASLANALAPKWRVVALDQRGHGDSNHAESYTRNDYLNDLAALFMHLNLKKPIVLLGNSLGGINAYHFAAQYPDLIRSLIIEDIGVEIADDFSFSLSWEGTFKTREELVQRVGLHLLPYLQDSFRQIDGGWKLAFDPKEMMTSLNSAKGNHWEVWLATECPVLLIRGQDSRATAQVHLEQMAVRRPNTQFRVLKGGHVVHIDNPSGFEEAVIEFLQDLKV